MTVLLLSLPTHELTLGKLKLFLLHHRVPSRCCLRLACETLAGSTHPMTHTPTASTLVFDATVYLTTDGASHFAPYRCLVNRCLSLWLGD